MQIFGILLKCQLAQVLLAQKAGQLLFLWAFKYSYSSVDAALLKLNLCVPVGRFLLSAFATWQFSYKPLSK